MNISSFYNYLNALETQTVAGNPGNMLKPGESSQKEQSGFEMALLSMINQSAPAYDAIEKASEDAGEAFLDSSGGRDAKELYEELTSALNSYRNFNTNTIYPRSIEESLFSMLNEQDSKENSSGDTMSQLLGGIVGNNTVS